MGNSRSVAEANPCSLELCAGVSHTGGQSSPAPLDPTDPTGQLHSWGCPLQVKSQTPLKGGRDLLSSPEMNQSQASVTFQSNQLGN